MRAPRRGPHLRMRHVIAGGPPVSGGGRWWSRDGGGDDEPRCERSWGRNARRVLLGERIAHRGGVERGGGAVDLHRRARTIGVPLGALHVQRSRHDGVDRHRFVQRHERRVRRRRGAQWRRVGDEREPELAGAPERRRRAVGVGRGGHDRPSARRRGGSPFGRSGRRRNVAHGRWRRLDLGDIVSNGPVTIGGTLHQPTGETVSAPTTPSIGITAYGSFTVPPACDCDPSLLVNVAAYVESYRATNDDSAVGLIPKRSRT